MGKAKIVSRDVLEAVAKGNGTGDKKFDGKVRCQNKRDIEALKKLDKLAWKADGKGIINKN